jgi:hypothetical protein
VGSSTKPRRKYRPKPLAVNPVQLAIRRARKVPPAEIAAAMTPVVECFKALREGVATENQWRMLAGNVELSLAIEKRGIVRGLQGHLVAAESALTGIRHRAMHHGAWKPPAMYWQEIDALDTYVWLLQVQLQELSEGELQKALDAAEANVRSSGRLVMDVREIHAEQLQLLGLGGHP